MQLRLILIRHGVTAGNLERRYVGQADDQPLTEHGRQELLTGSSTAIPLPTPCTSVRCAAVRKPRNWYIRCWCPSRFPRSRS